jgi:hypothetical protein
MTTFLHCTLTGSTRLSILLNHLISDAIKPFRYFHLCPLPVNIDPEAIFNTFVPDNPHLYNEFLDQGSIIIHEFFSYFNMPLVNQKIKEDFAIYCYHLRPDPGVLAQGFLQNYFHSIIQQAARMDPGYCMMNVAARPDHQTWLVSYPYVLKVTQLMERTGFMHMDINLDKYFSHGIEHNQLASSLSLTDKDSNNSTMIVPGFHKNAEKWLARVKQRI